MAKHQISDTDRVMRPGRLFVVGFFIWLFVWRTNLVRVEIMASLMVLVLVPLGCWTVFLFGRQLIHEFRDWRASKKAN